ncbi:hypothetical protein Dsin_001443 [Dipteronia sinensis]|uniref:Uncharacterized protein n=1 Tax=Dipteronia sinensis TaxID=43782 RepID=A0AAE0B4A6_9ROSI|nr:hypothetical protein Dsin_001443 [Dipteronia sinensis]
MVSIGGGNKILKPDKPPVIQYGRSDTGKPSIQDSLRSNYCRKLVEMAFRTISGENGFVMGKIALARVRVRQNTLASSVGGNALAKVRVHQAPFSTDVGMTRKTCQGNMVCMHDRLSNQTNPSQIRNHTSVKNRWRKKKKKHKKNKKEDDNESDHLIIISGDEAENGATGQVYTIDAAKNMNFDKLFHVEAKKFGYEPKSSFESISLAAVIQTQSLINPPMSRFTPAPNQSRRRNANQSVMVYG